jgi:hypothetical protein
MLGVLTFDWEQRTPLPVVRTALFPTRRAARDALGAYLAKPYIAFPRASVIRVKVVVEPA